MSVDSIPFDLHHAELCIVMSGPLVKSATKAERRLPGLRAYVSEWTTRDRSGSMPDVTV